MTNQSLIDPYREMNRYDHREEEWPSSTVYESPRRTAVNGWAKFHATRGCGKKNVIYVERRTPGLNDEKREYHLRCGSCGHTVDEDEVLFIGGEWYNATGMLKTGETIEDLWLPPERVLELGPDPDQSELVDALDITRIEGQMGIHGVSFGNESYTECETCGHDTLIPFDDKCRMCYDGPITDRMAQTLDALQRSIRERNNSFVHRLESHIDPFTPGDSVAPGRVLWRRRPHEDIPQMVVTRDVLTSEINSRTEYVLGEVTQDEHGIVEESVAEITETVYRADSQEIETLFYDTGLSIRIE